MHLHFAQLTNDPLKYGQKSYFLHGDQWVISKLNILVVNG